MLYIVSEVWPYLNMQTVRMSYFYGAIALCFCLSSLGCQKNVSGTYVGTCQNLTFQKQANITLILDQDKNTISGRLSLSGELGGDGPLSGQVDGSTISFTTSDPLIGKLFWTGTISGRHIKGTYHVDTNLLNTLITGTKSQQGSWAVAK